MKDPDWKGLTVKDFIEWLGIGDDLHKTLFAIERHTIETVDVFIHDKWVTYTDPASHIEPDNAITRLRVRGSAWDDSGWEWSREFSGNDSPNIVMGILATYRGEFREALEEHDALTQDKP